MNTLRCIGILLTILLLYGYAQPIPDADAYARKLYCFADFKFSNCDKWDNEKIKNLNILIIDRLGSEIHIPLVKDAINTWQYYTHIFNYTLTVAKEYHETDIAIYIDKIPLCAPSCAAGTSIANSDEDTFKYAMISLAKNGCFGDKISICREFDLQLFYRLAMHEFGHALGLGHSVKENNKHPISIMDAKVLSPKAQITSLEIKKLNEMYGWQKSPMPDMDNDCTWLLCYYVQGRINDGWEDKADIKMLEYDMINNCARWWVTTPTHNIEEWEVHVVFWNDTTVVSMVKFNITESQEVAFCTSEKTDGAQLGLY